jgi:carboxyl-terminal processing protease
MAIHSEYNPSYPPAFGTWKTVGYNKCFEITADRFSISDLSAISRVYSKEGPLEDFFKVFDRLEQGPNGQLHFCARGGITRYTLRPYHPLDAVRGMPGEDRSTDPVFNFEVFWHYFHENYAFFELRRMDWERVYRDCRPQVNARTTPAELTDLLTRILIELDDSHATLDLPGQPITTRKLHALIRQWQTEFRSDEFLELYPRGIPRLFAALNETILGGRGRSALNGQFLWGWVGPGIGYLSIFSMMDMYAGFNLLHYAGFEVTNLAYLHSLEAVVDQAVAELAEARALIIDVRFNPGGHDAAGRLIASRFADRTRLAFTKQARHADGLTLPQEILLEPGGLIRFTRPILLLTSEATASAAEVFTYFMKALPYVTQLGQKTRGVLSDMLLMRLPNGWTTSISNEVYTSADGKCYEGLGISPQVEAPVFAADDFYHHLDLTVQNAVAWIKNNGV